MAAAFGEHVCSAEIVGGLQCRNRLPCAAGPAVCNLENLKTTLFGDDQNRTKKENGCALLAKSCRTTQAALAKAGQESY